MFLENVKSPFMILATQDSWWSSTSYRQTEDCQCCRCQSATQMHPYPNLPLVQLATQSKPSAFSIHWNYLIQCGWGLTLNLTLPYFDASSNFIDIVKLYMFYQSLYDKWIPWLTRFHFIVQAIHYSMQTWYFPNSWTDHETSVRHCIVKSTVTATRDPRLGKRQCV